jgi:hypothetical protein
MHIGLLITSRARLLIFTGHSETVNHLTEFVNRLGYTTCKIQGSIHLQ